MTHRLLRRRRSLALAAFGVLLPVALATTSDAGQPDEPVAEQREALRERLETELARIERREQDLRDALARLDDGAALGDVIGELDRAGERGGDGATHRWSGERSFDDRRRERGPFDRPAGSRPDRPRDDGPITAEEREVILAFLAAERPEVHERVARMRRERPEEFERFLERHGPRLREVMREMQEHPERFRLKKRIGGLEVEARVAARVSLAAEDEQIAAQARARLRSIVEEQFSLRLELAEVELRETLEAVESRREEMARIEAARDSMIERRIEEILETAERRRTNGPRFGPRGR